MVLGDDEGKGIPVRITDDQGEEHEMILPLGARPDRRARAGHQGR